MTEEPHPEPKAAGNARRGLGKMRINKKVLVFALIAVLVLFVAFFAFQYIKTRNELNKVQNPELAAKADAESLAKEIGRYLELPQDETPTIATVSDADKLKEQTFFEHAENGDKVLVYATAGKAVLYRPSTKKVVEYAPVALGN